MELGVMVEITFTDGSKGWLTPGCRLRPVDPGTGEPMDDVLDIEAGRLIARPADHSLRQKDPT